MVRRVIEGVLIIVVLIALPVGVGAICQELWKNWIYSVLAGVGIYFLIAAGLMWYELKRTPISDADQEG